VPTGRSKGSPSTIEASHSPRVTTVAPSHAVGRIASMVAWKILADYTGTDPDA